MKHTPDIYLMKNMKHKQTNRFNFIARLTVCVCVNLATINITVLVLLLLHRFYVYRP
jgi:hypothetical protein